MSRNSLVLGAFLGDESKGLTTAFLADQQLTNSIIKISGGAQTAHNVTYKGKYHHEFSQFGSGFFSGIPTVASRYMMFNPFNFIKEAAHLTQITGVNAIDMFSISEESLLITPLHKLLNKAKEQSRGNAKHGSTHEGIGETRLYQKHAGNMAPIVADLNNFVMLEDKLIHYEKWAKENWPELFPIADWPSITELMSAYYSFAEQINLQIVPDSYVLEQIATGYNVFEASQGILLDEALGFHPHTTWSMTTSRAAELLSGEAGIELPQVFACTRTYATRHGAGPFPSEYTGDMSDVLPELHNNDQANAGRWRRGVLDLVLLNYAVRANGGVDNLSISHLDYVDYPHKVVIEHPQHIPSDFYNMDRDQQEAHTHLMGTQEYMDALVYKEVHSKDELLSLFYSFMQPRETDFILANGPDITDRKWDSFSRFLL